MAPTKSNRNQSSNIKARKFVEKLNQKVRRRYLKSQKAQGLPTNNYWPDNSSHHFKHQQDFRINQQLGIDQGTEQTKQTKQKKPSKFQSALEEFNQKKLEDQKKRKEAAKRKEEIREAMKRYHEKKAKKAKLLSKKTKKGQPILKYWIEDLLEKIQS